MELDSTEDSAVLTDVNQPVDVLTFVELLLALDPIVPVKSMDTHSADVRVEVEPLAFPLPLNIRTFL